MGKASRRRTAGREHQGSSRAAKDPGAQPAPFVAPPVRGAARGDRLGRAARGRPRRDRHRAAAPPARCRASAPQAATVATVLPLAWSGPAPGRRRGPGRDAVRHDHRRRQPRPGPGAAGDRGRRAGHPGPRHPAGHRRHPAAAGPARPRRAVRGHACTRASTSGSADARSSTPRARTRSSGPTTRPSRRASWHAADSAYWCRIGERTHLRWVLPHDEDAATDALARLHAGGASAIGDEHPAARARSAPAACSSRSGSWTPTLEAAAYEEAVAELAARFADALAVEAPLTAGGAAGPRRAC